MKKLLPFLLIFPILPLFSGQALALTISMADIVGGGDGTGTGTPNTGVNPRTGTIVSGITSTNNPGTANIYNLVPSNPFIDGVFVPDGDVGGTVATQVTSTGLTANLPNTDGNSWEQGIGFNAACCGGTILVDGVSTNLFSGGNNGIGFHSNKGITFDLDAIRTANLGMDITQYTALVGSVSASIGHQILLDGVIVAQDLDIQGTENATSFTLPINSSDRFLTLVGSNGVDGNYFNDQGIIGNPSLNLQASVPFEFSPSLGLLTVGGILAFARLQNKRLVRKFAGKSVTSFEPG